MAVNKKVGVLNLEKELYDLIMGAPKNGQIALSDLDPALQTLIRNAGAVVNGNYDDSYLTADIANLRATKADKTELNNYVSKLAQDITVAMLSDELRTLLGITAGSNPTMTYLTQADLANCRKIDVGIEKTDLSVAFQNEVNKMSSDIAELIAAANGSTVDAATMAAIQLAVNNAMGQLTTFQADYIQRDDDLNTALRDLISAQDVSISQLATKISTSVFDEFNKIKENLLDQPIIDKLDMITPLRTDFDHLKETVDTAVENVSELMSNKNVLAYFFSYSQSDTDAFIAAGKLPILDLLNSNIITRLSDGTYKTEERFTTLEAYDDKFFYDLATGKILALKVNTENPAYTTLAVVKYATKVVDITVSANSNQTYALKDPNLMEAKVLVKNEFMAGTTPTKIVSSASNTDFIEINNLYVNVAYNDNGITIVNDTQSSLTFRIVHKY